ncbi:MAG: ABC transporter permease, partial [Candidatus Electryoneaceae bacterium]|nr:ABC transporter permease [Candidatus Electryoneaceae bacterium]
AVLAVNGRLENGSRFAYYGPSLPESTDFFGVQHPEEIFDFIQPGAKQNSNEWIRNFDGSPEEEKYIHRQLSSPQQTTSNPPNQKLTRRFGFGQWWVLTSRYLKIKIKDSANTGILLAQAPIIAILLVLAYYGYLGEGSAGSDNPFWITGPLFVLSLAAIWFGSSNAAKEIIGEKAIYERERMINLKIPSYIFSKVAVLSALAIIQCGLMLVIIHPLMDLKGDFFEMFITLSLTAIVATIQGLLISTVVKRTDQALALVPISLLPQVVLSGLIIPLSKLLDGIRWIADLMLSRWSYEAIACINNFDHTKDVFNPATMQEEPVTRSMINILNGESFFQDISDGAGGFGSDMIRMDWLVLGGFAVAMLITMILILKSRDKV